MTSPDKENLETFALLSESPLRTPTSLKPKHVWLFARPHRSSFLKWVSYGGFDLHHWGVLVSDLSRVDLEVVLNGSGRAKTRYDVELGIMYELYRTSHGKNVVRIGSPFLLSTLMENWLFYTGQFIGTTTLSDKAIADQGRSLQ